MSVADWRDKFKKYDPRRRLDTPPSFGDCRTQYGFRWGPFEVQRTISAERRPGRGSTRVISIVTDAGHLLEAYISPTGRSVRVWYDHVELKRPEVDDRVKCMPAKWFCEKCGRGMLLHHGYWLHICDGQEPPRGGLRAPEDAGG